MRFCFKLSLLTRRYVFWPMFENGNFLDVHAFHTSTKVVSVVAVAIALPNLEAV